MARLKAPQRKEQLIEVATRVFAKYGYDAATTKEIAGEAGVTEPILYRHFETKEDLFVAITRAMSEQTLKHWRDLIADIDDPAEQLRQIAKQFPAHLKELGDAYRVIHNALTTSRDRRVKATLREHYTQIEKFFSGIIKAGQDKKIFRPIGTKTPCWHVINTGLGYAVVTLNLAPLETFDIEEAMEFLIRGIQA